MAAYAALLSLKHTIEQIQDHPRPPISLDQSQVDSLTDNINFLQDFLEGYPCVGSSKEATDVLECRIADAAHAAEDIIETRVVDQILGGSKQNKNNRIKDHLRRILTTFCGASSLRSPAMVGFGTGSKETAAVDVLESRIAEDITETRVVNNQILGGSETHAEKISSDELYQHLDKVIRDMGSIKKAVVEIKGNMGIEHHLQRSFSTFGGADSSRSPTTMKQKTMVGFDAQLIEVMDKLTGEQSNRKIIPIVGMGGIGKTTLARNAYTKPLIMQHFDIRAWVTISQSHNVQEILLEILLCVSNESRETLSGKSEGELGERVHKSLWGRRYLIVMDDIWSIEAWDKVQFYFPDNDQGSRIMITTRLSSIVFLLIGSHGLVMDFLDEDKSWDLLCSTIFEIEEDCPVELEEIGKKIAKNCKGLPLSIVVIGGLLAKSELTRQHWEYISENLNSIVNLEDNERCLKVLRLSYQHLPVHLKPCFLYMGVFREDSNIRVSWLVKLWVSEGFLKPITGKSLEVVSREYLEDLCDRNLIRVHQRGSNGKIKICNIHDLVRELCLREAEKEKFLYVTRPLDLNISQGITSTQRRIGIHQSISEKESRHALESVPLARSLIVECQGILPSLHYFRLLRVLKESDKYPYYGENRYSLEAVFQLVNSRFLAIRVDSNQIPGFFSTLWTLFFPKVLRFPSSVCLIWNLQTLIVKNARCVVVAPSEIWKMTQLRHVQFDQLDLPDPPGGQDDDSVLGNLQTLLKIRNFKCGEEVVKKIPNIKKLQIYYSKESERCVSSYCLKNLGRLLYLESFNCSFYFVKPNRNDMVQNLILPNSLKKLTLQGTNLYWEDMKTKIGLLPNLQVLKLKENSFVGAEWETIEGQFCNLKFLLISMWFSGGLECWTTDSTHFPRLEHLKVWGLRKLNEIPSCIGEIPTLQFIELGFCSDEAIISAKRISEEQEDLGNEGLRVRVFLLNQDRLRRLAAPNFKVET